LPARSIWNGTLAIGEVVFPVKLYALVQEKRVRFREVHLTDGGRIEHRRIGSESGQEIPAERLRRAYELEDGSQVVIDEDELASARGVATKVIEVEHFVPRAQLDPIFYERPYVLGAGDGGEHAYRVLQAALTKTDRLGIGRFVLRTREQLVALAAHEQSLRLYTLRFADEIVGAGELEPPSPRRAPTQRELSMAGTLVETMLAPWRPERYEDRHRQAVMELVRRKAAGEQLPTQTAPEPAPTPDLMAALRASLEARSPGGRKPRPRPRTKATPKPASTSRAASRRR